MTILPTHLLLCKPELPAGSQRVLHHLAQLLAWAVASFRLRPCFSCQTCRETPGVHPVRVAGELHDLLWWQWQGTPSDWS